MRLEQLHISKQSEQLHHCDGIQTPTPQICPEEIFVWHACLQTFWAMRLIAWFEQHKHMKKNQIMTKNIPTLARRLETIIHKQTQDTSVWEFGADAAPRWAKKRALLDITPHLDYMHVMGQGHAVSGLSFIFHNYCCNDATARTSTSNTDTCSWPVTHSAAGVSISNNAHLFGWRRSQFHPNIAHYRLMSARNFQPCMTFGITSVHAFVCSASYVCAHQIIHTLCIKK